MSSIPLPALDVKAPQQQDLLQKFGQLQQLQNMRQQSQMQQQEAPARMQILGQQAQLGAAQVQQTQQAQQDQAAFRAAMSSPENQGKTIGEVADVLGRQGNLSPTTWQQLKKADIDTRTSLATLDDKQLANMKAAHEATQQLYNNVMDMPDDQLAANWPSIAQQYDAIPGNNKQPLNPNQPLTKQQLAQFGPAISLNNTYLDQALARKKAKTEATTADVTLQGKQAAADFYAKNGGAPGVPVELMQQSDWLKNNPGKGPSDFLAWKAKQSPSAIVMGNQLGGNQNSDALDLAAQNYLLSGQMPPGLYRSPGTIQAIIGRAAEMNKQSGGPGIATNKAMLHANSTSLANLQKNFDQVEAFEQTAQKNMDLLQSTAKNIPDLGSRWANVPVRMLNSNMLGTANMAAFKTALATAQSEAAKVLNSSNATGVLSDSSRHELQDIIDGNVPYSALVASLNTLKQDMNNRTQSYQMQIKDIQGRIQGAGSSTSAANSGQSTSGLTVTAPNGKVYTFKDQQSADAFKQTAGIQ